MSLTARRRAEIVIERLGRAGPGSEAQRRPGGRAVPVLADILAFGARLPELPGLPQIACLDEKGRACVADAVGQLGWEPGDMRAWREGHWLVLEPAGTRGRTLKRRPAMSQVAGEALLSSIATMLAHSGFSAEDLARHMVTSATFPTVEEHVKQVLANAGSRNTRRTWKTHYDRLVMGTAEHYSCTCNACTDLRSGCGCACKSCEDKVAIPPCADRVLAPGAFVKSELERFKLVSERMATKKAVRDNQGRAARGLVAKPTDGKGGAENFVTAVRHLFQVLVDADLAPRRELADVIRVLAEAGEDGWGLWARLTGPAPWLNGAIPVDVLAEEPGRVLEAGRRRASNAT